MSSTRLVFLGPSGTFTEEAARSFPWQEEFSYHPLGSIPDVIRSVVANQFRYGVVPIENSIEGSVNATLDSLVQAEGLPILAEVAIPISQHLLMAKRPTQLPLVAITKVLSHPHAVAQCHHFLGEHLQHVEIEYTNSTAQAAQLVSENPHEPWAAIGTRLSSEIYPLDLTRESIQDYDNNYTRFILVGKEPISLPPTEREKTTILVTLAQDGNYPGALYQVLAVFAWRKISLSRVESRPTKRGLGSYHFVLDIEQKMDEILLPSAFAEIEALGCQVRQLGTYPYYIQPTT